MHTHKKPTPQNPKKSQSNQKKDKEKKEHLGQSKKSTFINLIASLMMPKTRYFNSRQPKNSSLHWSYSLAHS